MAILDRKIREWNPGVNNAPSDADTIGIDLAAQIRNIKSVYRDLSLGKAYEYVGAEYQDLPYPWVDAQFTLGFKSVLFYLKGDLTTQFQIGRKIIAKNPGTGELRGGVIWGVLYTQSANKTTVMCVFWGLAWESSFTELYLGTDNVSPTSFPMTCIGGVAGIRGAVDSAFTVVFSTKQNTDTSFNGSAKTAYSNETKFFMPTKDYMVHLSPCYRDDDAKENSTLIKSVTKDFHQFAVTTYAPPGLDDATSSIDQEVFFDWCITMPRYYS